jgi:hypothetical protein
MALGMAPAALSGFIAAGWLPVPAPSDSPAQVAAMFRDNPTGIKICTLLISISGTLTLPLAAVIGIRMRKIEGAASALAWTQMLASAAGAVLFMVPTFPWQAAAYRASTHSDEMLQTLNDLGWLPILSMVFPFQLQLLCVGLAILMGKGEAPELPRWSGYLCLWGVMLMAPSAFVLFFFSGPFAWNGVFTFYLAGTGFFTWYYAMCFLLLRATNKELDAARLADTQAEVHP